MASYAFTTLDYIGISTNFQILTGINNAGYIVGYYGDGQPVTNLSVSYVWMPTDGIGSFTSLGASSVSGFGPQTRLSGINNGTAANAPATIVGAGISASGTVTGAVTIAGTVSAGAAVKAATQVTSSGGSNPELLAVNDGGAAVGFYVSKSKSGGDVAASIAAGGRGFTAVAVSIAGATVASSMATGIDDTGDVAGTATLLGGAVEGFVDFANGTTSVVAVAGAVATQVLAIDNQLQVAGSFTLAGGASQGFVYDFASNTYTTIDAPGALATMVDGINDQGDLVGSYVDGSGNTHALLAAPQGAPQVVQNPVAGSTISAVAGSAGVAVSGSNAVTLLDPGYGSVTLVGNVGADKFVALASRDTIVASVGNNTVTATVGGSDLVYLGDGSNSAVVGPETTVASGRGHDSITAAGSLIFAGDFAPGMGVIKAGTITGVSASNTIVGGAGTTYVSGESSVAGDLIFGGSGTVYANPGDDTAVGVATMVGGSGVDYFDAGANGGLMFGGSGTDYLTGNATEQTISGSSKNATVIAATTIVAGSGATTVTGYTGSVFLTGATGDLVVSGASSVGNLTLVGTQSTGNDTYVLSGQGGAAEQVFEGSGNDYVYFGNGGDAQILEGAGAETFVVGADVISGADTIYGFRPGTDQVLLQTYDAASVQAAVNRAVVAPGGSLKVNLNGVSIDFFGIGSVSTSFFHPL